MKYRGLASLMLISLTLHLINALSVPLTLDVDSPSYLQGAVHFLRSGNLDGVSAMRGPGSSFLFIPVLFLFGRNPWGLKILLHLLAIGCVPIAYRVGWQLSKNKSTALLSGSLAALSPDLFMYSNFVMSDLPNILLVLLFCTLLISALETFEFRWMIAALLTASFASLLRPENAALLMIGALSLLVVYAWQGRAGSRSGLKRGWVMICLAIFISIMPVLWWSARNQRVHGFFGLSNYAGEVFYDGWVYFGDASGLSFTDRDSEAIRAIRSAVDEYPIVITDKRGVPTGWEIYPSLIRSGYDAAGAFDLLEEAAWDSIQKDPGLSFQLLLIKSREALVPEAVQLSTLRLPGEDPLEQPIKAEYFDEEGPGSSVLINFQRDVDEFLQAWYGGLYPYWIQACVLAMCLSLFRSPGTIWIPFVLVTATRVFIPNIIGLSHWRYTLAGLIPLQIILVHWMTLFLHGGASQPSTTAASTD